MSVEPSLNENSQPAPTQQNGQMPRDNFDKLLSSAMRLLRHQQEQASVLESNYQQQRAAIFDSFRAQVDSLKLQTEEQVLALDGQYRAELDRLNRTITALRAMRVAQR